MKNFILTFASIFISAWNNNSSSLNVSEINNENSNDPEPVVFGRALRDDFMIAPGLIQLNHGSYGTYPKAVRDALHKYEERSEANSDLWIRRDVYPLMANARTELSVLVNAVAEDIVFVPNTTGGMNAIFRSLSFVPGTRILFFNTAYYSMQRIIQFISDTSGGKVTGVQFDVHYPISDDELVAAFESFVNSTPNITLALIDHISSVPAVKVPIERLIPICKSRGILTLIDGAHGVGQIHVNLKALAPDFYISSLHKWLFVPRGAGMLYVDKKYQEIIHPATIASGYTVPADFQSEFYWTGTIDYCHYLMVPAALAYRRKLGGEDAVINYTHELALNASKLMAIILESTILQSPDQIGNMFDIEYPLDNPNDPRITTAFWTNKYLDTTNIFVASYPNDGKWYTRVSAQVYIELKDFEYAALIIKDICNSINNGSAWLETSTFSNNI